MHDRALYFGRKAAFLGFILIAGLMVPSAQAAVFSPTSFTLKNGLKVIVVENHRAPVVAHMVWYRVGSADEPPGKSGIAHFLEHLMFKGTKRIPPGEFSKIIARAGGRDNAFTYFDYTGYFQLVAADKLDLVMGLEADRMENLVLTDAETLPERDVVMEERRSRVDNSPAARLSESANAEMFGSGPYGVPVIGWENEIRSLSTQDALDFYRTHYAPNNAILIVAGDVTPDQVHRLAMKHYGPIARRNVPPRIRAESAGSPGAPGSGSALSSMRVTLTSPQVGQPSIAIRFPAPGRARASDNDADALTLLAEIAGGGATSRLYRALVVKRKIASSVGVWYGGDRLGQGLFVVQGSPAPGSDLAVIEAALKAEITLLADKGVSGEELERARSGLLAGAIYARDSLRAAPNILGRALTTGRSLEDVESWPERIAAVTKQDIKRAARRVLGGKRTIISELRTGPEEQLEKAPVR